MDETTRTNVRDAHRIAQRLPLGPDSYVIFEQVANAVRDADVAARVAARRAVEGGRAGGPWGDGCARG